MCIQNKGGGRGYQQQFREAGLIVPSYAIENRMSGMCIKKKGEGIPAAVSRGGSNCAIIRDRKAYVWNVYPHRLGSL